MDTGRPSADDSNIKNPSPPRSPIDKMAIENEEKYRSSRTYDDSDDERPSRYRRDSSRSPSRKQSSNNRRFESRSTEPARVLGVFGLSFSTREIDLEKYFSPFGPIENCVLITDRRSGHTKGFGFVTFQNQEDATRALEQTNGTELHGRPIRVDYSYTKGAHDPTPGRYMGKRDEREYGSSRHQSSYRRRYDRSRSPYSSSSRRSRSPPRRSYRRYSRSPPRYERRRSPRYSPHRE